MKPRLRILLTGATGLLGRALHRELAQGHEVFPIGFRRGGPGFLRLDLTDARETERVLEEVRPDFIVHAAAERKPDMSEKDPEGTMRLNVEATRRLAAWAGRNEAALLYFSSDYLFDGTRPPYRPSDAPNPLNFYGKSKWEGEKAALAACPRALSLRVPLLYGPVEDLAESPVTVIVANLLKNPETEMEDWATRYPTYTPDVARAAKALVDAYAAGAPVQAAGYAEEVPGSASGSPVSAIGAGAKSLPRLLHFSGEEPFTKYEMALVMVETMKRLGRKEFERANPQKEPGASKGAPRPKDSHLDCAEFEALFKVPRTPFRKAIEAVLAAAQPSAAA